MKDFPEYQAIHLLGLVCRSGNKRIFESVWRQGEYKKEIDTDAYGYTILENIVLGGNVEIFHVMNDKAIFESYAYTPGHPNILALASESGSEGMIDYIASKFESSLKEMLTTPDSKGYTPYHRAVMSGCLEAVKAMDTLIERVGATAEFQWINDITHQTLYTLAADYLDPEGFQYILDKHYDESVVNAVYQDCIPLLHQLMINCDPDKLKIFSRKKPDLCIKDSQDRFAVSYGNPEMIRTWSTALKEFLQDQTPENVVRILSLADAEGFTVAYALAISNADALQALLAILPIDEAVAILSLKNPNGVTVAHMLAKYNAAALEALLAILPIDKAVAILSLADAQGVTVAYSLAQFNAAALKALLAILPIDKAVEILRLADPQGVMVALYLALHNADVLQALLAIFAIDEAVALNPNVVTVAHYLAQFKADALEALLARLPIDKAVAILSLADPEGFTVAHYLAKYNAAALEALLTRLPIDKAVEILSLADVQGVTVANTLVDLRLARSEGPEFTLEVQQTAV